MAGGLILILSSFWLSYKLIKVDTNTENVNSITMQNFQKTLDYASALKEIGGGIFENEDFEINLNDNWILNETSPEKNSLIADSGDALFNAYSIEEDSSVPWIFSITQKESFDIDDYILSVEGGGGIILEELEDGSFIMEFENGTNQKTKVMQKIVKTTDQRFIILSLTTVNTTVEKVKETINYLLGNTNILKYEETVRITPLEEVVDEEEVVEELEY